MGGGQGASGRGNSSSKQQAVGGVEMCGPASQARELSRQGMTHTHLLNLTLPWCLPFFLAIRFFQPPLLLSRAVKESRLPTPHLPCPGPGHLGALGIPPAGREPSQLSRARQGARKGSFRGKRRSGFKTRAQDLERKLGLKENGLRTH